MATEDDAGPVQILSLDGDPEQPVVIHTDQLDAISNALKEENADFVSIISVMGTYRTGKSFLLDFLMRYLRYRAAREDNTDGAGAPAAGVGSPARSPDKKPPQQWTVECEERGITLPMPEWVLEGDAERLSEGYGGQHGARGFGWRPGPAKCTNGIWLWRKPFMFTDLSGRRIGVLLMDTQGAWDSEMSQDQSATIFGLTALLSSKLIYNIQNRIEEDKIANLDYFTSFAEKACGAINHEAINNGVPPFGTLQFLIRDWGCYEGGWTLSKCKEQMLDHLNSHMNSNLVPADKKDTVERLSKSFKKTDCFGLIHPGLKLTRPKYDGRLADIDQDFIHLLDSFTEQFFGESFPCPSAPLGSELTTSSFSQTVRNFAEAFANSRGMAIGLREAFVKVQMMQERDSLFRNYRRWLENDYPDTSVIDPLILQKQTAEKAEEFRKQFKNQLSPFKLKQEAEEEFVNGLMSDINQAILTRTKANEAQVDGATIKVVATPVVGMGAWFAASHAWLVAVGGAFGGYIQMLKHSKINQTEMLHPSVMKGIGEDVKKFMLNRWRDIQAMSIAAQRLEPNKILEQLMGATVKAQAALKAASAGDGNGKKEV